MWYMGTGKLIGLHPRQNRTLVSSDNRAFLGRRQSGRKQDVLSWFHKFLLIVARQPNL